MYVTHLHPIQCAELQNELCKGRRGANDKTNEDFAKDIVRERFLKRKGEFPVTGRYRIEEIIEWILKNTKISGTSRAINIKFDSGVEFPLSQKTPKKIAAKLSLGLYKPKSGYDQALQVAHDVMEPDGRAVGKSTYELIIVDQYCIEAPCWLAVQHLLAGLT